MKGGNSISLLIVFILESKMSLIGFHPPISCATQRNAFWSHTKREGFTEIHPAYNFMKRVKNGRNKVQLTEQVPKIPKKKRHAIQQKLSKRRLAQFLMKMCLSQSEKYLPPCLFRSVSRSFAVKVEARVKWPTKPAQIMSILINKNKANLTIIAQAACMSAPVRRDLTSKSLGQPIKFHKFKNLLDDDPKTQLSTVKWIHMLISTNTNRMKIYQGRESADN